MKALSTRIFGLLVVVAVVAAIGASTSRDARAVLPPLPNTVQQWDKIAEDTVVGSGAFQGEGEIYMSYESLAVYNAVVAIRGGFQPYGSSNQCSHRRFGRLRGGRGRLSNTALLLLVVSGAGDEPGRVLLGSTLAVEPERMHGRRGQGNERWTGSREQHHRPSHGGRATDTDRYNVYVRDEGSRPGSMASYSTGVLGPANAVARVGAAVPAEEARDSSGPNPRCRSRARNGFGSSTRSRPVAGRRARFVPLSRPQPRGSIRQMSFASSTWPPGTSPPPAGLG